MALSKPKKLLSLVIIVIVVFSVFAISFLHFNNTGESVTGITGAVRVACIGDSITENTEYPSYLQRILGDGYMVQRFSVVGATILLNTDRPFLNQTELQYAKNFSPNLVVIMLGTNDARNNINQQSENFEKDYQLLINEFQDLKSKPKLYLAVPPPIFDNQLGLNGTNLVKDIIPRIKQTADVLGLPSIDVYSALVNHADYLPDGVHPNSQGARTIAITVYNTIVV